MPNFLNPSDALDRLRATSNVITNPKEREEYLWSLLGSFIRQRALTPTEESLVKENKLLKAELDKLKIESRTDPMTKLPNRNDYFANVLPLLEQFYTPERRPLPTDYLIIFFDLDGLKGINDTLGHDAGDKAILNAATILNNCIRKEDWIGRIDTVIDESHTTDEHTEWLGRSNGDSDEFTAVISINGESIQEVMLSLQRRISLKIQEVDPTLSIAYGVAIASEFSSLEEAYAFADRAMYDNKKQNKEYSDWLINNKD